MYAYKKDFNHKLLLSPYVNKIIYVFFQFCITIYACGNESEGSLFPDTFSISDSSH